MVPRAAFELLRRLARTSCGALLDSWAGDTWFGADGAAPEHVRVNSSALVMKKGVHVQQTEVEFVPLYTNQPLFAEVDIALRELGFVFHRFGGMAGRTMKPLVVSANPYQVLKGTGSGSAM
jgi:hypothetical protein